MKKEMSSQQETKLTPVTFEIVELDDTDLAAVDGGTNIICPQFNMVAGCGSESPR